MYLNTKSVALTESYKYTMKNLVDYWFEGSNTSIDAFAKKMDKITDEFYTLYTLDDKGRRELLKAILAYNEKSKLNEILDFKKCDSFHHLHLFAKLGDPDFSRLNLIQMYRLYYKLLGLGALDGYFSKYTHTVPIDGRFIVFISFDEKGIGAVESLASENMFDITANMTIAHLKVDKSIFKKK